MLWRVVDGDRMYLGDGVTLFMNMVLILYMYIWSFDCQQKQPSTAAIRNLALMDQLTLIKLLL